MNIQELGREIGRTCDAVGDICVRSFHVGNTEIKSITISGAEVKEEGIAISAIFASEDLACKAALENFSRAHAQAGSPHCMLWRRKPELQVHHVYTPGHETQQGATPNVYYSVTMRVAFVTLR